MRRSDEAVQGGTTKYSILEAVEHVFAECGYAGATVKYIVQRAECYKSLIYYHCGSKENLFIQVLKHAHRKFIRTEQWLELDFESPQCALKQIVYSCGIIIRKASGLLFSGTRKIF